MTTMCGEVVGGAICFPQENADTGCGMRNACLAWQLRRSYRVGGRVTFGARHKCDISERADEDTHWHTFLRTSYTLKFPPRRRMASNCARRRSACSGVQSIHAPHVNQQADQAKQKP